MPNLLPPTQMSGKPVDNPTPVVLSVEQAGGATTPGVGNGLKSPADSAAGLAAAEKEFLENSVEIAGHMEPGSSVSPVNGT